MNDTGIPKQARKWLVGAVLVAAIPLLVWGVDWSGFSLPQQATTASATGTGLVVVTRTVEQTLHFGEGQDTVEVIAPVGGNTPWVALPIWTDDYLISTRPENLPYIMCVQDKGCFQSNPDEHSTVSDMSISEAVFRFQGVESDTVIVVRACGNREFPCNTDH